MFAESETENLNYCHRLILIKCSFKLYRAKMKRLKECSGLIFIIAFFPFLHLYSQTLGPPKAVPKDYNRNGSSIDVFSHKESSMHNTFYSSHSSGEYFSVPVNIYRISNSKVNQIRSQMKEIADNFLPADKMDLDFSEVGDTILSVEDIAKKMLMKMPSRLKLDPKPSTVCLSKQKMPLFGVYTSLGFFNLPESGAFGEVYKILGISLWQNIAERIKIREKIDIQFAQSCVLKKDILREYYTDGEVSGYRLDMSEKYTFNGVTISVDLPVGLIYSPWLFLYLYSGFGMWYANQYYKCTRTDTYELISEKDMSLVKTQSFKPVGSIGILFLTRIYRESRFKAITFDLGYHFAKNEKSMNSSFFMDIDRFTHMWLISAGFML